MPSTVKQSVVVDRPIGTVYNQWTQFEKFPEFMEGVESVRQIDDSHLHWVTNLAGHRQEWDAEILEQTPDRRISWRNTSGDFNEGIIDFLPTDDGKTQVLALIRYHPSGVVEGVGDLLGMLSQRVQGNLERFKHFLESRDHATGAWRGEIHQGFVETEHSDESINK